MIILPLQSGSNGNCIYVESAGTRLLVDAGISGRQAELRLAEHGRDIRDVDALLISHDHRDHTMCMGVYQRKYGLPVHITRSTFLATRAKTQLGRVDRLEFYDQGNSFQVGAVTVETVPTPHDAVEGVAFIIDDGHRRVGILTDLGHVFEGLYGVIESLDAVLIESNYDPYLLASGQYPEPLKRRIRGPGGHISNREAADLLKASGRHLQWACLGHLSEHNNTPEVAERTHREVLSDRFPIYVASRYTVSEPMEVAASAFTRTSRPADDFE